MQQHSECEESQVAWLQRFSLPAEKAWRNNMFIKGAESCISSHRMYAELVTPKGCSDRSVSGSLPPINLQIHHWPYTWAQRNWLLISWHCFQPLYCPILPLASCPHLILPSYTSLDFLFISASIVGLLNDDTTMSWAMTFAPLLQEESPLMVLPQTILGPFCPIPPCSSNTLAELSWPPKPTKIIWEIYTLSIAPRTRQMWFWISGSAKCHST